MGSNYHAPLPLDVAQGLQVGLNTGTIAAGASFTVTALTPRDTFTYTINSEPFTLPVIVISYSDPQGSHRFITPAELPDLDSSLAPYAGQMLQNVGLQIVTTGPVTTTGSNTTNIVVNSPHPATIEDAHLYLDFVSNGELVGHLPYTLTLDAGPTVYPAVWSTSVFSQTYDADADNILIAFWTDRQGNIIDSAARPLNTFATDPKPAFAMSDADLTWDFGTVTQGEVLKHTFTLANTGFLDLYTYLAGPTDTAASTGTPTRTSTPTISRMPIDTTTPTVDGPTEMFGDGRDGDLTVTGTVDLNPVRASASGMAGSNILTIAGVTGGGFQAEQLVLIHQTRGIGAGKWEFNYVQSVSTGQLTMRTPLKNTYTTDAGVSRAQVLWVPQYRNLTVEAGATVSPAAWNGDTGGILVFLSNNQTTIGGTLNAKGKGFRGETCCWSWGSGADYARNWTPHSGEGTNGGGWAGIGSNGRFPLGNEGGSGDDSGYPASNSSGAGGGNGSTGSNGQGPRFGYGGNTAGSADLTTMVFGGGGGGGGFDSDFGPTRNLGGHGGSGGGIIIMLSRSITITGSIDAKGHPGNTGQAPNGNNAGGGGGAGGSVLVKTMNGILGSNLIDASGGNGGPGSGSGNAGGAGGVGRVRIEYCDTFSGSTNPPASVQQITCSPTVTPTPPPPLTLAGPISRRLSPGDTTTYTVILDTSNLPAGPYDETITIRTSDPANPTRTVQVAGNIQALANDALSRRMPYRPWDRYVWVPGDHNQNEQLTFPHRIDTDPAEVEPLYVYGESRTPLLGTGAALPAGLTGGALPSSVFGDGRDGDLTVNAGQFVVINTVRVNVAASGTSAAPADSNGFSVGDTVLFHQTQGTANVGRWELNQIAAINAPNNWTLARPLTYAYDNTNGRAQVIKVPQYRNATVQSGGTLTAPEWDGNTGGIVILRASNQFDLTGVVSVNGGNGADNWGGDSTGGASGRGFKGGNMTYTYGQPSTPGFQGDGTNGVGSRQSTQNGNGGGGSCPCGPRGAGGGNGTSGQNTSWDTNVAYGGSVAGSTDLAVAVFGGGGGGGVRSGDPADPDSRGAGGGGGAGIIMIFAQSIDASSGSVTAKGGRGGDTAFDTVDQPGYAGGGGAGGSILIKTRNGALGTNRVTALGGAGGSGGFHGNGGSGGVGRIRVEYQTITPGWSTDPPASSQQINFFAMEKVDTNTVRYTLPESFTGGRTYWMQFGQRYVYTAAGDHVFHARLPKGRYSNVTLDVILSRVDSVPVTMTVYVSDTLAWTYSISATAPTTATTPNLATPLNTYLASATPDPDGTVAVPIRVTLSTGGELFLTNFVATPASGVDVTLAADDISFGEPVVYSARLADGTPTEGQLVPVQAAVHNNGQADSGGLTVSFFATAPGWGETLIGVDYLPNVPAGLSATAVITWNTLGFTGTVPVRVHADPFNRVPETDDENNDASTTFDILSRPDLHVGFASLFREPILMPYPVTRDLITPTIGITSEQGIAFQTEVVVGETYTITLSVGNAGQSEAGAQTVALYDGNPDAGGTLIGETRIEPLSGISDGPVVCCRWVGFAWTPDTLGPHRLFARVDRDNAVDEFDEGNNEAWRDFYVGFRESIVLDSGNLSSDPAYTPERGYGFVYEGQYDILGECGNEPEQTYRLDPGGRVVYRFDHLSPSRFYHLDLTLYECGQGAGRQESVYVDSDNLVAGPEDLGDGEVHRLSVLLDPAFYTDRTITVTVESRQGLGALVNEIALHDVDYRYADSGGANDPGLDHRRLLCVPEIRCAQTLRNYGWLDGTSTDDWGSLPYQTARVDLMDNDVRYYFEDLDPLKRYRVHLTFYQGSGNNRVQRVQIDGQSIGEDLTIVSGGRYSTTLSVPLSHYAVDGSIVVSVVRTNASVGAMVNEIALEEETQASAAGCSVTSTPSFSQAYGSVTINDQPAPAGSVITAESPRGDVVGCAVVTTPGQYPFTPIYGEDPTATPPIPGMREGEPVAFRVNGALAVSTPILYWEDNPIPQRVDLAAGTIQAQAILLSPQWNLISFNVEPPVPSLEAALRSITGKFCRVLAETQIYDCNLEEHFRTLRELHGGQGYYVRVEGGASVNLLVEGVSIAPTTPIPLHQGWNWAGYLPSASLPVTVALQSIEGDYRWVHNGRGETYDPTLPGFSRLTEINPGDGIWIYATQPVNLTYPATVAATARTSARASPSTCAGVIPTPYLTVVYGSVTVNGVPAPAGTQVEVISPRGDVAGCFIVEKTGQYGFMHVYGEDNGAPPLPGFRAGERLRFRVNGVDAIASPTAAWQDDHTPHQVDLEVALLWRIHLPTIFKHDTVGP